MTSTAAVLREVESSLSRAGLHASVLVRLHGSGEEVGLRDTEHWPLASLAKVHLAVAVLAALRRPGGPSPEESLHLTPGRGEVPAAPGVAQFERPVSVSVLDALYLAVSLSDPVASEALLRLVPWSRVEDELAPLGLRDTRLRSPLAEMTRTPAEQLVGRPDLAQVIGAAAGLDGGGHLVPSLDRDRASTGTARDVAALLDAVWRPEGTVLHIDDAARVRRLLHASVHRQRLWPEFASPASTWASKTGTLLHLRHEAGVVEHEDGDTLTVVVMTSSTMPAATQPYAEFVMAQAARRLHDHLRGGGV